MNNAILTEIPSQWRTMIELLDPRNLFVRIYLVVSLR